MRSEKAFVTGVAGFIGSHLAEKLLEQDYSVVGYDNFDLYYSGKERNLTNCVNNRNFRLIKGDILDFDLLQRSMKRSKLVFHLAAQPGVRFSSENPWKTTSSNVTGTLNVLLAARNQKVRKVIFASSSSVYGAVNHFPCSETEQLRPLSIYGASKLAAEEYCRTFSRLYGLNITILRYHTVYGPRQRPDMAIRKFVKALLENGKITVYGDGSQTRDFTYVSDAVAATMLAPERGDNDVFNIGGGVGVAVNEVLRLLIDICGKTPVSISQEKARSDDMPATLADISKAQKILGYEPKVKIKDGLEAFVKGYKQKMY